MLDHRGVAQPALHPDAQPQGFGVCELAVVQTPDVELRAGGFTALKQQRGEVVAGDRVGRIELVGLGEARLGLGQLVGADLANAFGQMGRGATAVVGAGQRVGPST